MNMRYLVAQPTGGSTICGISNQLGSPGTRRGGALPAEPVRESVPCPSSQVCVCHRRMFNTFEQPGLGGQCGGKLLRRLHNAIREAR
jgi:hypothetical protein